MPSPTVPASPQTLLNKIYSLCETSLKLSLDVQNSHFPVFSATVPLIQTLKTFWPSHLQITPHNRSALMSSSFPQLQFHLTSTHNSSTGFLFLAWLSVCHTHLKVFPTFTQICHNLFFCQPVYFTCFSHFYFCAHIQHYYKLLSTRLQLNNKCLGHPFVVGGGVLTALFGLKLEKFKCYCLRHEGLTTTHWKAATYSEMAFHSLLIYPLISGLLLYTVQPPKLGWPSL
jgi:hypothetical protein